jgi:hypothetical protein
MRLSFRRWWFWSAAALLLVSAAVLYISFGLSHRDRVTMGHVGKLKLGMKESEVRRILGEEPALIPCSNESRWKQVDPSWSAQEWNGKCMGIRILFDSNGRLCDWTAFIIPDGKFEWTDRVVNWIDWMGF